MFRNVKVCVCVNVCAPHRGGRAAQQHRHLRTVRQESVVWCNVDMCLCYCVCTTPWRPSSAAAPSSEYSQTREHSVWKCESVKVRAQWSECRTRQWRMALMPNCSRQRTQQLNKMVCTHFEITAAPHLHKESLHLQIAQRRGKGN